MLKFQHNFIQFSQVHFSSINISGKEFSTTEEGLVRTPWSCKLPLSKIFFPALRTNFSSPSHLRDIPGRWKLFLGDFGDLAMCVLH
jgi:hypothetical protein